MNALAARDSTTNPMSGRVPFVEKTPNISASSGMPKIAYSP
jgi:hypothetical protein